MGDVVEPRRRLHSGKRPEGEAIGCVGGAPFSIRLKPFPYGSTRLPPPHFSLGLKGCAAPGRKKSSSLSPLRGLRSGIFLAPPLDPQRNLSRPAAFRMGCPWYWQYCRYCFDRRPPPRYPKTTCVVFSGFCCDDRFFCVAGS